jgi:hypothetical protein
MKCTLTGTIVSKLLEATADSKPHNKLILTLICFLALFLTPVMQGQATGSFSGNVLDKSGAGVAGASVTATSPGTGLARDGKTDTTGHYLLPLLPVGTYTVRVDASGFQSAESRDLHLQIDEAREVDFALVPAAVVTTVAVTGEAIAVESANPSLGQVITSQQVSQLPLNGRDFVQLATLTAGATAETNPNSFFTSGSDSEVAARGSFSLSVGGSRPNSTDWLLDGVDNNELTAGGIGIFSSIDDISEFKVLTYTYSAEYGTRAGPTVLVTTKGGTNALHGSLFEFVRNTDLDAKSYFAAAAEKFNLNQFGGSVGGPLHKDKTFLFVDGEQKDQLHGIAFTGLVPTQAMMNGDFSSDPYGNQLSGIGDAFNPIIVNPHMIGASTDPSVYPNVYFQCDPTTGVALSANTSTSTENPMYGLQPQGGVNCNKIPSDLFNPIAQNMMAIYPATNANNPTLGYNYVSEPVRSLFDTKFDGRLDQNFSARDNAFARFSYEQAFSHVPGGSPGLAEANAFGSNEDIRNHARNVALGETHIFSPTILNQASIGYNRIFDYILSQGNGSCESAKFGIPGANLGCPTGTNCEAGAYSCGLVSTEFQGGGPGYWSLGDRGYSPFQGGTNIFSFKDAVDIIHHNHDIKFGLDFRDNQMNVGTEAFQDGFWIVGTFGNFTGLDSNNIPGNTEADFLLGIPGLAIHDQTFDGSVTGRRWKIFRPFVQDDWRVTPSLTLNLGVAWDLTTPTTEEHGRLANYDPDSGQIMIAGQGGVSNSAGVSMDREAFEPRLGLAWKVFGSEKTVFRAGYAFYHDSAWSQGAQGLWQNPPFLGESDAFPTTFSTGCAFAYSYCAGIAGSTPENISLSNGFATIPSPPTAANFTGTFYTEPTNLKLGRVQQFNVNIERELVNNLLFTVGYAGSRGSHILVAGNDLNVTSPGDCGTGMGNTIGCLPGGGFYCPPYATDAAAGYCGGGNAISLFGDVGTTNYDSLQVKAETKGSKYGLYALIAYTYSKTLDNGLSDGLGSELSAPYFPLPNWQHLDWSLSQIDLRNSFTASMIYDLPFGRGKMFGSDWNDVTDAIAGGWQLTLIERISSGFPVPLIDSNNTSGSAFENGGNDNNWNRPNTVADCNPFKAAHGQLQWFNPACYMAPGVIVDGVNTGGELGDAARVPLTGPDFVNTDFSIVKQFALPREGTGLNFRAEFFNLFNHPQFGSPNNDLGITTRNAMGVITSANGFGSVSSTVNNPRLVQLALKLTF